MSTYLPQDLHDDLDAARLASLRKRNRLRVLVDGQAWPLLRLWQTGFSVESEKVPSLRGLVDVYDGTRHLYQCLIVASGEEAGEMRYDFKRNTAAQDQAPLDHIREADAPIALLPR